MIYSMTGFGRGRFVNEDRSIAIEIKAVNHRFLDMTVKTPRTLSFVEDKIKAVVQDKIQRGKVDIFVTYTQYQKPGSKVNVDEKLAKEYAEALKKISTVLNLSEDVSATKIASFPEVLSVYEDDMDEELVWSQVKEALSQAIDNFTNMRAVEGENLKNNLLGMAQNIENSMETVKEQAPKVPLEYKAKLEQRIANILQSDAVDPTRLAQEVAFFADKCSIDEEITRMGSHIGQMRDILNGGGPVGRKLDFLVQEMNREANTMGSKANNIILTNTVLEMKSEIEKIREQIQNLE